VMWQCGMYLVIVINAGSIVIDVGVGIGGIIVIHACQASACCVSWLELAQMIHLASSGS
jgi:hypothetical protein